MYAYLVVILSIQVTALMWWRLSRSLLIRCFRVKVYCDISEEMDKTTKKPFFLTLLTLECANSMFYLYKDSTFWLDCGNVDGVYIITGNITQYL